MLRASKPNSKLKKKLNAYSFDLPAGHTCPGASLCFARSILDSNNKVKIIDAPEGVSVESWNKKNGITPENNIRCYAASGERMSPVRDLRYNNYNYLIENKDRYVEIISEMIEKIKPEKRKYFRLHSSGDFFSRSYYDAWLKVARKYPETIFYCYTKMAPFVLSTEKDIPDNMRVTLSIGGKWDKEIQEYEKAKNRKVKIARVVFTEEEAEKLNLEIDRTDELASTSNRDFAILIHGQQPKGTRAVKIWHGVNEAKIAEKRRLKEVGA